MSIQFLAIKKREKETCSETNLKPSLHHHLFYLATSIRISNVTKRNCGCIHYLLTWPSICASNNLLGIRSVRFKASKYINASKLTRDLVYKNCSLLEASIIDKILKFVLRVLFKPYKLSRILMFDIDMQCSNIVSMRLAIIHMYS